MTFFPPWAWPIPGIFLACLGYRNKAKKYVIAVFCIWVLFGVSFAEEPRSLVRGWFHSTRSWEDARAQGKTLRVISLNCAGQRTAAREVLPYHSDIILLQESPDREFLKTLAQQCFQENASYLWGIDTSILARGKIFPESHSRFFVRARVQLPSGKEIQVISLRLHPPTIRMDLWSGGCWRDQTQLRCYHCEQIKELAQTLNTIPSTVPLLVGGDFNSPGGDGAMKALSPRLHDTFLYAGIGWGNTGINEFPVARIDQIWVNDNLPPSAVRAQKTQYSDHRMVICDLFIQE